VRIFAAIILTFLSLQATQAESPVWYEGSLVLKSKEVIVGKLSVHPFHDIVLFKAGDELRVYTADKVQSFYFFDVQSNMNRKFISLQEKINAFTTHALYEVVLSGEIKVLRKVIADYADPHNHRDSYHYSICMGEETIPIHKFRTKVYPGLISSSNSLARRISETGWNPSIKADIILIIDYYNKEARSKSILARH
jgi:hypothetical protein